MSNCYVSIFSLQPGGKPKKPLDNNIYSTKKTVAQGMMDLALLTANASQLKLLLKYNIERTSLFFIHISCICISIVLQVTWYLCLSIITTSCNEIILFLMSGYSQLPWEKMLQGLLQFLACSLKKEFLFYQYFYTMPQDRDIWLPLSALSVYTW